MSRHLSFEQLEERLPQAAAPLTDLTNISTYTEQLVAEVSSMPSFERIAPLTLGVTELQKYEQNLDVREAAAHDQVAQATWALKQQTLLQNLRTSILSEQQIINSLQIDEARLESQLPAGNKKGVGNIRKTDQVNEQIRTIETQLQIHSQALIQLISENNHQLKAVYPPLAEEPFVLSRLKLVNSEEDELNSVIHTIQIDKAWKDWQDVVQVYQTSEHTPANTSALQKVAESLVALGEPLAPTLNLQPRVWVTNLTGNNVRIYAVGAGNMTVRLGGGPYYGSVLGSYPMPNMPLSGASGTVAIRAEGTPGTYFLTLEDASGKVCSQVALVWDGKNFSVSAKDRFSTENFQAHIRQNQLPILPAISSDLVMAQDLLDDQVTAILKSAETVVTTETGLLSRINRSAADVRNAQEWVMAGASGLMLTEEKVATILYAREPMMDPKNFQQWLASEAARNNITPQSRPKTYSMDMSQLESRLRANFYDRWERIRININDYNTWIRQIGIPDTLLAIDQLQHGANEGVTMEAWQKRMNLPIRSNDLIAAGWQRPSPNQIWSTVLGLVQTGQAEEIAMRFANEEDWRIWNEQQNIARQNHAEEAAIARVMDPNHLASLDKVFRPASLQQNRDAALAAVDWAKAQNRLWRSERLPDGTQLILKEDTDGKVVLIKTELMADASGGIGMKRIVFSPQEASKLLLLKQAEQSLIAEQIKQQIIERYSDEWSPSWFWLDEFDRNIVFEKFIEKHKQNFVEASRDGVSAPLLAAIMWDEMVGSGFEGSNGYINYDYYPDISINPLSGDHSYGPFQIKVTTAIEVIDLNPNLQPKNWSEIKTKYSAVAELLQSFDFSLKVAAGRLSQTIDYWNKPNGADLHNWDEILGTLYSLNLAPNGVHSDPRSKYRVGLIALLSQLYNDKFFNDAYNQKRTSHLNP